MASHRSLRLEKGLVLLLLLTFGLPLVLSVFVHYTAGRPGLIATLRQSVLYHPTEQIPPRLPLTVGNVRTAHYQEALANRFDANYAGRDWVHRLTQEAYLRVFGMAQGGLVLGRHHSTYANALPFDFVDEYSVHRPPPEVFDDLLKGLRLWRDSCRSRGVGFTVVITPSKAAVYPEDLPRAWRHHHDPRPRAYDHFIRLLQQEHIPYVDGHLLTLDAKAHAPAPVFPLGGTHWDQFAALQTANGVLRELASQGQPLAPIEHVQTSVDNDPVDADADMVAFMQPLIPWHYPVTRIDYPPVSVANSQPPSLTIIGGSFVGYLGVHLYRSQEFSEIHWLRYYNEAKEIPDLQRYLGWRLLSAPVVDLNVEREVYAAQNLVLEVNESYLLNSSHLRRFFADTLNRLPGPDTPKFAFPYETFQPCGWNEPVRFALGTVPTKPGVFSGLAEGDPVGSWSNASDTVMRLTVPDLDQDVVLKVVAGASAAPDKHPLQTVNVFANGQPVAEWVHPTRDVQTDTAVIPKALLADGRLVLRFHYSQPAAPSSYSASPDHRPLGLLFINLTLSQFNSHAAGPLIAAGDTGQGNAAYALNFSGAEPSGRWTVGPSATLRFPTPPGDSAVTLSAELAPLVDPVKLPVQRTGILVNGQPAGEWVFDAPGLTRRELVIPRALLTGDPLEIELRFSKTISPAEMGTANDTRQMALLFRGVQLHWLTSPK